VLVDAVGISMAQQGQLPLRLLVRLLAAIGTTSALSDRRGLRRPRVRRLALAAMVRHPMRIPLDLIFEQTDGTGAGAFRPAMAAMLGYDFCDRLPEIRCPTLIVHGADDKLVPVRDAYEFERLIPDSAVVVFDDTGHLPMLERPRAFNAALVEFL